MFVKVGEITKPNRNKNEMLQPLEATRWWVANIQFMDAHQVKNHSDEKLDTLCS